MNRTSIRIFLLLLAAAVMAGCTFRAAPDTGSANTNTATQTNTAETPSGTPLSGASESSASAASALVTELYKLHDADKGPFREKKRAVVDKYFAKPLADLIWKDKDTPEGEIGAIDFDPLYDGQDFSIKNFSVGQASVTGTKAVVIASFENFGEKNKVTFDLTETGGNWKIADIKYTNGFTLLGIIRENMKAENQPVTSPSGEFEGRYRVGDTTCTVEFKNKGYAVKWAKGSGVEYFSFMEGTTFASSTVESEANKFVFDDENYHTGTFFRADGKTFPVSRAK
ncbi:MAG: DUF3828 domain-containing protein [Chloracidobacterium sp.]|nr:DUF3828 domain-containing protein [Chloracidobacterium sp.]